MTVKINDEYTINDQNYICKAMGLDFTSIIGLGKPTKVTRGIRQAFSLPIFNNDNEELNFKKCIPSNWNETSNIIFFIHCWLDTANTDKRFNFELATDFLPIGTVVPDNPLISTREQIIEGSNPQYKSYRVEIGVDAVAAGYVAGDQIDLRLRRIAASQDEMIGEIVVGSVEMKIYVNKVGSPS